MPKLSDVPSEALAQALSDLELVEQDEEYVVDMYSWHEPNSGGCKVCLAGAVLAKTVKVPINVKISPNFFMNTASRMSGKLYAMDSFARGDVSGGLSHFGIESKNDVFFPVPTYESNPDGFKSVIKSIIKKLKEIGH